ncbi:hypothetical protein IQ260_09310 [Leptolyngbya cf. ectocarpi LEGE 11479]|uniref:Uncharacterized protein n=1 Tax=Leptolyngbya cf. ectocarpi LEGE 11479 TaxID=1828722 RepID=A0A928ZR17_LEPEC|nr:hypothetical protein [Leptolyngbya ectocarpi]MBE9066850.1 hypothetical protein [Leptolyngbya cf. ectocarpi LEGE 11479]
MAEKISDFDQAVAAYKDSCDRNNMTFQQPSEEHSELIHNVMYLRKSPASYVARYDTRRQRVLA